MVIPEIINTHATKLFQDLFDRCLKADGWWKHKGRPQGGLMPLNVERIGDSKIGTQAVQLFSVMHTYTQNGDMMRDPDVTFAVLDRRDVAPEHYFVVPLSFRMDGAGIYAEHIVPTTSGLRMLDEKAQADLARFVDGTWAENIRDKYDLDKGGPGADA